MTHKSQDIRLSTLFIDYSLENRLGCTKFSQDRGNTIQNNHKSTKQQTYDTRRSRVLDFKLVTVTDAQKKQTRIIVTYRETERIYLLEN